MFSQESFLYTVVKAKGIHMTCVPRSPIDDPRGQDNYNKTKKRGVNLVIELPPFADKASGRMGRHFRVANICSSCKGGLCHCAF